MTRSSPVTARICASTAARRASRLSNQDDANIATSAMPRSAATGIARRLVLWAIVNGESKNYPSLVYWNRMRASGSRVCCQNDGEDAKRPAITSKERQLDG